MGETRINLKHLLEDLRDSYPFPQEEAIVTELIANALDSRASHIQFHIDRYRKVMSVVDDGKGMGEREFEEYHDIAATTKVRGKGIGFAGVGVKLALIIAEEVITETRRGETHKATRWRLESNQKAPWHYVDPSGLVGSRSGTAVSIFLPSEGSDILDPRYIEGVVQRHFYPLLDDEFMNNILKYVYKDGVYIFVNGKQIESDQKESSIRRISFHVAIGRRDRPIGIGFICKNKKEWPEEERGLAISTYGKVIKRGWDWIGMNPRNPTQISGIAELPKLSEILTTNKADFLKDSTSLQKFYRYRRAIQKSIEPILRSLGEISTRRERDEKDLRPLEREIERVLGDMLDDFPELSPLLGRRRKHDPVDGVVPDQDGTIIGGLVEGTDVMTGTRGGSGEGSGVKAGEGGELGERIEPDAEATEKGRRHRGRRRRPGLMIGVDDNPDSDDLGWLSESTIWINQAHPAYRRATSSGAENYHIVFSVSWALSGYLEGKKSPQMFLNQFLSSWGRRL